MKKYTRQFMNEVKRYLDGKTSRLSLTVDLTHYFIELSDKMAREDEELFLYINDVILDEGLYTVENASDAEFKEVMATQYQVVIDADKYGLF